MTKPPVPILLRGVISTRAACRLSVEVIEPGSLPPRVLLGWIRFDDQNVDHAKHQPGTDTHQHQPTVDRAEMMDECRNTDIDQRRHQNWVDDEVVPQFGRRQQAVSVASHAVTMSVTIAEATTDDQG